MNQEIQRLWENRQCPIRSGIYFDDGRVIPFRISMTWSPQQHKTVTVTAMPPIKLNEISAFQTNQMTHLGELCEQTDLDLNLHAYAGEGAWGSEGFIALTHLDSKKLVWIAYFEDSNPFTAVSFDESNVTATSTLGHVWQMCHLNPDAPSVTIAS